MYYFVSTVMPYIMSAITIYMNVLAGSKKKHAWAIGLGNQLLWLIWIIVTGNWGFIFMNLALWIVYFRNHVKWQEEVIDAAYYEEDELPTVEVAVDPQTPLAIAWENIEEPCAIVAMPSWLNLRNIEPALFGECFTVDGLRLFVLLKSVLSGDALKRYSIHDQTTAVSRYDFYYGS